MTAAPVVFHFDFISPYSYVASQLVDRAPYDGVVFDFRPVIFGSMLSRLGVKGPGEIPARRRIGLQDVMLLSQRYDIPLEGPPTHPFNSIYALRSVCAVDDLPTRRRLALRYFRAGWAEGVDLAQPNELRRLAAEVGIDQDPEATASDREIRRRLKAETQALLDDGGWGVPTFRVGDVLLFGHERLDTALALINGQIRVDRDKLASLLARPQPGRIV